MPFLCTLLASNPLIDAYRTSDLFGKAIFASLFLLSVLTWSIVWQKIVYSKRIKKEKDTFFALLKTKKELFFDEDVSTLSSHSFCSITRALREAALPIIKSKGTLAPKDREIMGASVEAAISEEVKKLKNNLTILSTTISLAPFLGLLGTVWGILLTFGELQAGGQAASSQLVMGGLSMALGTTVCGLVVAIPALIAYNSLKNKAHELNIAMEDFGALLLAYLESGYSEEKK